MNKELQDKLYKKYPKIFGQKDLPMTQTAMCWGISCGDGWYNIIDTLCEQLQNVVDKPHEEIAMYEDWIKQELQNNSPRKETNGGYIPSSEEKIAGYQEHIEKLKKKVIPQLEAVQVKEKYGSLRFYLQGYPVQPEVAAKVTAYINFAESLSCVTCESCGSPGKNQGKHWVYTLCNACLEKQSEERAEMIRNASQLKLPFGEK